MCAGKGRSVRASVRLVLGGLMEEELLGVAREVRVEGGVQT